MVSDAGAVLKAWLEVGGDGVPSAIHIVPPTTGEMNHEHSSVLETSGGEHYVDSDVDFEGVPWLDEFKVVHWGPPYGNEFRPTDPIEFRLPLTGGKTWTSAWFRPAWPSSIGISRSGGYTEDSTVTVTFAGGQ
jgi:hypothetical protein